MQLIKPGQFDVDSSYYTKVLNAQVHPLVYYFMNLSPQRIIDRYCHLNPQVDTETLRLMLEYRPRHMLWAGADLFHVTTMKGERRMLLVETNSSPSGQKSMPLLEDKDEAGGYERLIRHSFLPFAEKSTIDGSYVVLYDKNEMEATAYAKIIAEVSGHDVILSEYHSAGDWRDGIFYVNGKPVKAIFRYVTQKPWDRFPLQTKTLVYNPVITCLAGGRNKLVASKAYELFNSEYRSKGLKIHIPYTVRDVQKQEVPFWVKRFRGYAVVKVPYLNAGQGVYTITSKEELEHFMNKNFEYDQFIVQSLIGNSKWSSDSPEGKYFHIGTMPNNKNEIYVADIRMMVAAGKKGIKPMAVYARRALQPLTTETCAESWNVLGTNLSYKEDGAWKSDSNRLLLMDRKDFNKLGIGIDQLIESYIQTVLSLVAIDKMASYLSKDGFNKQLFRSLNNDKSLLKELYDYQA